MRNALQDQLLKAGLATDRQAKKSSAEKRKETQQKQGNKTVAAAEEQARLQAQRAQVEKAERDRQLNLQRKEAAERKALAAQIKQLAESHRRPTGDGDIAYNFADGGKVKKLLVSETTRDQLVRGLLAIVKVDDRRYEVVPREVAEKIRARDAASVIVDNAQPPSPAATADDPYAQYQVPDDLTW